MVRMDYVLLLGSAGLVILLIAFIIEHLHRKKSRFYFNVLNAIGSFMLGVYAIYNNAIIFVILEFIWVGLSIFYLIRKE